MRAAVKYRLIFLCTAIISYYLGFAFIPETTTTKLGLYPVILASIIYFVVLPIFYWFMIIKAGKQKAWKLLIIFSLSSAIARFSFPEDIAQHFDFILWLRYPIIAVLLIIELYLMFVIVKGLWQARNLTGDPRISVIEKYDDDKKQALALTLATEPASWYYAIPRLSKRHIKSIDKINLLSSNTWHFLAINLSLIVIATLCYQLLVDWSETLAIIAATFILYGFIMMTANYRLSRYYSIYIQDEKLIINNTIFNFMVIPLADITSVSLNPVDKIATDKQQDNNDDTTNNERLIIGRSKYPNIKITFKKPIKYWGMMGAFVESFEQVLIKVEQPTKVINALEEINSPQ
ncbi:hypothetical protein H4J38_14065 [Colwellia sp. BRX10-3]|uniref:hypothetical protein n=1 Tax=Colwellia sp. BRX10-3 TaxID=2759844 RepID=UPI0015F6DC98|nr:hypothetical protein [Colwellia sp. BRX10-3]MBA6391896.1 hypothetical protein [Colwellia sp. BRX10-3]